MDLRVMFQELYVSDKFKFDENKLKLSVKIYFDINMGDMKWIMMLLKFVFLEINFELEKIWRLYVRFVLVGGFRWLDFDLDQMKIRLNFFFLMKMCVYFEVMKFWKEVEKII